MKIYIKWGLQFIYQNDIMKIPQGKGGYEMQLQETSQNKIFPYDGYQTRCLWEQKGDSTYYDYETDRQCRVPLRDVEVLKAELGLK